MTDNISKEDADIEMRVTRSMTDNVSSDPETLDREEIQQ